MGEREALLKGWISGVMGLKDLFNDEKTTMRDELGASHGVISDIIASDSYARYIC
jgi:hypothetical protein